MCAVVVAPVGHSSVTQSPGRAPLVSPQPQGFPRRRDLDERNRKCPSSFTNTETSLVVQSNADMFRLSLFHGAIFL